jgi:pyruvate kinase
MVTLPTEAARNYQLVHDLVDAGMNSARINCAHDDRAAWMAMIQNVRLASEQLRRKVRVCMDLGGPKIRTGLIKPGPSVLCSAPRRDNFGFVKGPAIVWLSPAGGEASEDVGVHVPVSGEWVEQLEEGDVVYFHDTRRKERNFLVVRKEQEGCWAQGFDRAFLVAGTVLHRNAWEAPGEPVGKLPPKDEKLLLKLGERLILHKDPMEGESAELDDDNNVIRPAHVSCTNQDVFVHVELNDRVRFDDGNIEGRVVSKVPGERLEIEVTYTKAEGQKLGADKGINFPDSKLKTRGLTTKDREDLEFVVEHADVVNMSFVNTQEDVQDLIDALDTLDARDRIGVVLKIETQSGFNNLTEILLKAMQLHPVGVMIARGDLAVETGWENMALIQEEILGLCHAAHVPEVWATQVLETLAKKGLPSRAEVTDAASSLQAECVMLNKGSHIIRAVKMLDAILKNMKDYRHDRAPMLPPMNVAE